MTVNSLDVNSLKIPMILIRDSSNTMSCCPASDNKQPIFDLMQPISSVYRLLPPADRLALYLAYTTSAISKTVRMDAEQVQPSEPPMSQIIFHVL